MCVTFKWVFFPGDWLAQSFDNMLGEFFLGLSPGSIARERVVFISFLTSANPESWALLHSHLQQAALQDVCHGTHTAMAQQAVPGTELKKSRRSLALDASDLFWEDKNN